MSEIKPIVENGVPCCTQKCPCAELGPGSMSDCHCCNEMNRTVYNPVYCVPWYQRELKERDAEIKRLSTLVRNAVANVGSRFDCIHRWGFVTHALAVGSTTANALCHEFKFDPDDIIGQVRCDNCPLEEDDQ